jgi:hypothetical protein
VSPDNPDALMSITDLSHGYCPGCSIAEIKKMKEALLQFKKDFPQN